MNVITLRTFFMLFLCNQAIFLFSQTQVGSDIDGLSGFNQFGHSVALSANGNRVAVGANLTDTPTSSAGEVRIYELQSGNWTQVGSPITGNFGNAQAGYATALSDDGNRVAFGAIDGSGTTAGYAEVYEWNGATWNQLGNTINGEIADDQFGYSITLSSDGSRVAVGAPFNDQVGGSAGHTRVYELQGATWMQLGNDIDGEAAGDESGHSVSLSSDGSRVAIGAHLNDGNTQNNIGHVRVYDYNVGTTSWNLVGGDINGETTNDRSGFSVDISADGGRVVVGATSNDAGGVSAGHARVFELQSGNWTPIGGDMDGEAAGDQAGFSVSISADGNLVAVGSPFNSAGGQTRIYELQSGTWTQQGTDINGEGGSDRSGHAVALSDNGQRLAIGATRNDPNGSRPGHTRVFGSFVLPVELSYFSGKHQETVVLLSWSTASEINNAHFEIEHSTSDFDWKKIGFQRGAGNAHFENNYEHEHKTPNSGGNYYRLKQVDFDGRSAYSSIVEVFVAKKEEVAIYPNPVENKFYVSNFDNGKITIVNNLGQVKNMEYLEGNEVDISHLEKGVYSVLIEKNQQQIVKRILKN